MSKPKDRSTENTMPKPEEKEEIKSTIPEPEEAADNTAVMFKSEQDLAIEALVKSAQDEPPVIDEMTVFDLKPRFALPLIPHNGKPTCLSEVRSENHYRWVGAGLNDHQKELRQYGGKYEIVTRTNHSCIPSHMFFNNGAIMGEGHGNILAFCRKQYVEMKQEKINKDLSLKEDDIKKKQQITNAKGDVVMEIGQEMANKPGSVFNSSELLHDSHYDVVAQD